MSVGADMTMRDLHHISTGTRDPRLLRALEAYRRAHPVGDSWDCAAYLVSRFPASRYTLAAYEEYARDRMSNQSTTHEDSIDWFDAAIAREKAARQAVGRSTELGAQTILLLGRCAENQTRD